MTFRIRRFTEADYAALPPLIKLIHDETVTEEGLRWDDDNINPKCKWGRWVAEAEGRVVGAGGYTQYLGAYHPQRFELSVGVHPEYRRRGIGSALYETVLDALREYDPNSFGANVREDIAKGLTFASKRGFTEKMRTWESHLDLPDLDLSPYAPTVAAVAEKGYTIRSFTELADLPDRDRQVWAMIQEVRRDVPSPTPLTDMPFDHWLKGVTHKHFWPEAYLLGLHGRELVGISALWKTDEPEVLHTGLTAVGRAHRGTGLALALKVRALERARAAGFQRVKTWNESNNQKMLAINIKLGFKRKPAWIHFDRQV